MVKTKKELIQDTALQLFAEKGYDATPTSLIAKEAGVSEGLIFRHFINKENLLEALVKAGYRRIADKSRGLLSDGDPYLLIHDVLELPLRLVDEEKNFWRMQYRLVNDTIAQRHHARYMKSVNYKLTEAFEKLGYKEPKLETEALMILVEALWKFYVAYDDRDHLVDIIRIMKDKYKR